MGGVRKQSKASPRQVQGKVVTKGRDETNWFSAMHTHHLHGLVAVLKHGDRHDDLLEEANDVPFPPEIALLGDGRGARHVLGGGLLMEVAVDGVQASTGGSRGDRELRGGRSDSEEERSGEGDENDDENDRGGRRRRMGRRQMVASTFPCINAPKNTASERYGAE